MNMVLASNLVGSCLLLTLGGMSTVAFTSPKPLFASSSINDSISVRSAIPVSPRRTRHHPPRAARQSALHTSTSSNSERTTTTPSQKTIKAIQDSYDVIVVGSGIGGLSCAAMLALYGYSVAVFESHYAPGGCAHGYTVPVPDKSLPSGSVYRFDTGPSFFSGLNPSYPPKQSNPLRTVLEAVGEEVECLPYTTFGLRLPEGEFLHSTGFARDGGALQQIAGQSAVQQWDQLMRLMEPLAKAVDAMPAVALRQDIGVALTAGKFLPNFAKLNPLENLKLTKPFRSVLASAGIEDGTFTKNWLDLLCFCLSGLPTEGTITAEMAMMMGEFYEEGSVMDCPVGGASSVVDALVRGVQKRGGQIFLNNEVEQIAIEDGRAVGVVLKKGGKKVTAKKAVVSNLSVWDLYNTGIADTKAFPSEYVAEKKATPVGKSFMHLHIGFRATREELDQLEAHYMYIDDWERGVEAEDNAALISIPSVHDDTLAPDGHAVLHIYTPATEDYSRWKDLDRKSPAYEALKEERSRYLWTVLETVIPDIRSRANVVQVGTPLTHQRFLRRYEGSYGPAIVAGEASFPFPGTPVKGLLCCGDSCFPGIGVPAVAGSGILAANSVGLESLSGQMKVLDMLQKQS